MNIIEQIMKPPENVLTTADSIDLAIDIILSRSISTCPITNPSGEFCGQITDTSIMRAIILRSSGKKIKCLNDLKSYFLHPPTISKSDSLTKLLNKIFKAQHQRVFVVDANNKLLGIIKPKDLIIFLIKELNFKIENNFKSVSKNEKSDFQKNLDSLKNQIKENEIRKEFLKDLFEDIPNIFITFDSNLKLSYANKSARKLLGIKPGAHPISINTVFFEQSSNLINQFIETSSKHNKPAFKQGYFSVSSLAGIERRYEMSINYTPNAKKNDVWLTCLGRPVDVEMLLRKLNGVFQT